MTKITRLPNGVTVITEQREGTGKVAMNLYFKSGGAHESDAESGLTNLMQEATQGGTTTRSRDEIFEGIESAGGSLSSGTAGDGTSFSTEVIARKAEETFKAIADILRNPAFDQDEIDKARDQIKQIMAAQQQSPGAVAKRQFAATVFKGQSAANDPAGTPETLDSFTRDQVVAKHAEMLSNPNDIYVSFAGDIDPATAEKLVKDAFGDIPANAAGTKPPVPFKFKGGDTRLEAELDQMNFIFAFPAPDKKDTDRFAVTMLKEALAGGMSRPLFQEIREKRQLVYTVGAGYSAGEETGWFTVAGGAGKGNAGELVKTTIELLGEVARNGFTQQELDEGIARIMRNVNGSRETAAGSGASNLSSYIDKGRITTAEEYEANLRRVTPDDIKRVAYDLLKSGDYGLSAVGPLDTLQTPQEIKELIKQQAQGVTPPARKPVAATAAATFNAVAKKAEAEESTLKMTVLPNGIKVISLERPGNLSAGAWVGAGADYEVEANNGSTHMLEHMVFKGTPNWPSGTIDKYVEGELGGGLNAYTTRDKTAYYYYNLEASALEKIVEISGEMVFMPILTKEDFDGYVTQQPDGTSVKGKGERDVVIEELRRANDNASRRRQEVMAPLAYPDQPHGWSVLGPESTLRAMTVEQLQTFHDEFYAPNNVIFSASGPVKHEDFVKMVEQKFGHLKPNYDIPELYKPTYKGGTGYEESRAAKIVNFGVAAEGVSASDPDSAAYQALGQILGGGQSSRLYKELVSGSGLVPGVGAGSEEYRNAGLFHIAISGIEKAENVKPFLNSAYKVLRDVANNVTQDELDRAKTSLEMQVLGTFETNDDAVNQIAVDLQAHGKVVQPADLSAAIQAVTLEDIKRVAKKVLASNPTVGAAVPPGTDPSLMPTHAEVVAMRDGTWQAPAANANKPNRKPPAMRA